MRSIVILAASFVSLAACDEIVGIQLHELADSAVQDESASGAESGTGLSDAAARTEDDSGPSDEAGSE
jgi:hypothetical protein